MRAVLVVVSLLGLASASDLSFYKFMQFINDYGKDYNTKEEFDYRYQAFKDNLDKIDRLNMLNVGAGGEKVHGINEFADMPYHEFAQRLMKPIPAQSEPFTSVAPDADIDWRTTGAVTAVKDQGQCGSCWAHSATEAVESYTYLLKAISTLEVLSVQQTTACTYTNYNGCNGGWPYVAYTNAVLNRGGEDTALDYPYNIAQASVCKFGTGKADKPVVNIKGYVNVTKGQLATALTTGPPSVCLCAETWQSYTGGVLKTCCDTIDHCVQAVGIGGSAAGAPYWLVRNSWGTGWGVKGYIYLDATVDSGNLCHIQEHVTHPTE